MNVTPNTHGMTGTHVHDATGAPDGDRRPEGRPAVSARALVLAACAMSPALCLPLPASAAAPVAGPAAASAPAVAVPAAGPEGPADGSAPLRFRLRSTANSSQVNGGAREFSIGVDVQSLNKGPVTLVGIGRSGPGLRLMSADDSPQTVQPKERVSYELRYRVTDCDAVPRKDWPVPVRVRQGTGRRVVEVPLAGFDRDAMEGGEGSSATVPWQAAMAGEVCRIF
ncbi:hypothetical protein AB0D67_19240 [Streptosporangium sp. NPDC048047]|uniref:hypothetical protein n=1 Tax=Streptosporangium sp. NPDC048047 TaxID=3155748 RepID=UPI0034158AEF